MRRVVHCGARAGAVARARARALVLHSTIRNEEMRGEEPNGGGRAHPAALLERARQHASQSR
jgi:hypothetical protein